MQATGLSCTRRSGFSRERSCFCFSTFGWQKAFAAEAAPTATGAQPSQSGSFFATATFFSVTYFGRPSRPQGSGASPRISGCR